MAKGRYPRRGQRIAPSTLGDLLQITVPGEYLEPDESMMLADLDESAWDRFDEPTCRHLGGEVLKAVGRAARMPMALAERSLPALPSGLRLADLDLEIRTLNCLISEGLHKRPRDLGTLRIEGLLALRGFWVKCLVDLLVSLEYVNDHPEARRALRSKSAGSIQTPRVACRYPRQGHRLAPELLSPILADPIPDEAVADTPLEGSRLCDLDATVWRHLERSVIEELAEQIVNRVNVSGSNRAIQDRPLPTPPANMRLEDLRLENRTHNCLRRAGFAKKPAKLGQQTVGDLLAIDAFGAKCLVDLLTSLETLLSREGKADETLLAEARALKAIPAAHDVRFSDPRLGPLLRTIDTEANTLGELVELVLKGRFRSADPFRFREQLGEVRARVEQLVGMSLEEELVDIFAPAPSGRDRQIVAEYYGWDGKGGHTLEQLGKAYGLSRERIRQVCVRAIKRNRRAEVFAPVLDQSLEFLANQLPVSDDRLRSDFAQAGLSQSGLSLETVLEAAAFLSRPPPFQLVAVGRKQLAVRPEDVDLPGAIVQVAKRTVLSYGATTIADVAADVASAKHPKPNATLTEATLSTLEDFRWLDQRRGWFQLESLPQYGLPNMIDKILSVTNQIDVTKLRQAIARYRRSGRKVPPPRVLLAFCDTIANTRIDGNTIIAEPPKRWQDVLTGVEAGMVGVLTEHGPVMDRGAFEEICIAAGMNRFSFNAIIMCSPVIAQYGRSVYGLLGAKVSRKTLKTLTAQRIGDGPSRVLGDFGKTKTGRLYLTYHLSKAAISGGVITVPAAMKTEIVGKFAIQTADGKSAGTLVSKNGCAWGLGPVLRGRKAQPGDYLLILLDPKTRQAEVHLGDKSILAHIE